MAVFYRGNKMKKILIITNIPSPYRVDLFYYMQTHIKEYKIYLMYCAREADNRCWHFDENKLVNTIFAKARVVSIRRKFDTKHIYIPKGIQREISRINPDVVIGWEYNPVAILALYWCKIHKKKYISLTDGTLYSERNINLIQRATRKVITKQCDAAIASSTKAKEKLLKWGLQEKKIFVSLLTVDIEKICKSKTHPEQGRLLYVGSMIERKGLDLLISALKYINVEFKLRIVGNGSEAEIEELKNRAKSAKVENKIYFCGFLEGAELIEEYQKAQAFILPTREDCFGLVLLEAACAGVPIISSKYADGAYDVIVDGENGLIIDPYNSKEFGTTIEKVLTGEVVLNAQREEVVRKFSFSEVTKGYVNAINYVLKGEK